MILYTESDYIISMSNLRGTLDNCAMTLPIETGLRHLQKLAMQGAVLNQIRKMVSEGSPARAMDGVSAWAPEDDDAPHVSLLR